MGGLSVSEVLCFPTDYTHAGSVNPNEAPDCLLAFHGQCPDKGMCRGAIGVPMPGINAPTPIGDWLRVSALGLKKVLLESTVVQVHIHQHSHLFAFDVCGCGFVGNPHTNTVTYRVLSPIVHRVSRPLGTDVPVERVCAI